MSESLLNTPPSRFEVRDPREIRSLLQRLINARALLTIHKGGNIVLLSSILGFDDTSNTLQLDTSADSDVNQRALTIDGLNCSGNLERIEVRFPLGPLRLDTRQQPAIFEATIPEHLTYLQRREYYRLLAPARDALACEFDITDEHSGQTRLVSAPIIDISNGGVALRVPAGEEDLFTAGRRFERCRLRLPKTGLVEGSLQVRHVGQYAGNKGQVMNHVGCEWQSLNMGMQNLIQRYIMRVERERVARDRGLL